MNNYGFEVTNDAGEKQIVDTAPALYFYRKYVAGHKQIIFEELFAVKPSEGVVSNLSNWQLDKGAIDPSGEGQQPRHEMRGAPATVIAFRFGMPKTSTGFGLEVFGASGQLQFSSNQRVLRVLDVINTPDIYAGGSVIEGRRTHWRKNYGNKEVAVITIQMPIWPEGGNTARTIGFARRGEWFCIENGHYADIPTQFLDSAMATHLIIVDVTGY